MCLEEHYKKHYKDYQIIRLNVYGDASFSDWEEMVYN
jgi:hypothetical protein